MKNIFILHIFILLASAEVLEVVVQDDHEAEPDKEVESQTPTEPTFPLLIAAEAKVPNITVNNTTEETNSTSSKHVACARSFGGSDVQLINDTELIQLLSPQANVTNKDTTEAPCVAVLFYSKYCPFSSMAAPHFNALPRAFPDIRMVAINAMMYHLLNAQNGIVGVPSMLLFHNGRAVGKFNYTEYTLENFSQFLKRYTGIEPEEKSYVTSADFAGPLSSVPSKETDIFLGLSWGFVGLCGVFYFTKSKWWRWIVETVQSNWRESEAQHEHQE